VEYVGMTEYVYPQDVRAHDEDGTYLYQENGMTLRDYFAGQALVGIAQRGQYTNTVAAAIAYEYADALMKARGSD
jgi:hypothetical protein